MERVQEERDERGLRAAVLAGDEDAWRVLYDRCFDSLFAYVYVRTQRDVGRTEETVQECWAIAVRRIRSFDPARGRFGDWLHGIADRLLLDQRRRWARRQRLAQEAQPVAEHVNPGPSDTAERFALVLTALPEPYQAVLRAKYEEHRSVADIAQSSGRSAKAIESQLSRARAAFREAWVRLDGKNA